MLVWRGGEWESGGECGWAVGYPEEVLVQLSLILVTMYPYLNR